MTQYQIPEDMMDLISADERRVSHALQRNADELRKLQQVLEVMREEGFHKPPVQTQQPKLYLVD